jgi:hypothetical protein
MLLILLASFLCSSLQLATLTSLREIHLGDLTLPSSEGETHAQLLARRAADNAATAAAAALPSSSGSGTTEKEGKKEGKEEERARGASAPPAAAAASSAQAGGAAQKAPPPDPRENWSWAAESAPGVRWRRRRRPLPPAYPLGGPGECVLRHAPYMAKFVGSDPEISIRPQALEEILLLPELQLLNLTGCVGIRRKHLEEFGRKCPQLVVSALPPPSSSSDEKLSLCFCFTSPYSYSLNIPFAHVHLPCKRNSCTTPQIPEYAAAFLPPLPLSFTPATVYTSPDSPFSYTR